MTLRCNQPGGGQGKRERVKNAIRRLAGEVGPNGKLPTVKELCRELSITKVTLNTVLDALDSEGLINRRQGSGIYVRQRPIRKRSVSRSPYVALLTELNLLHPGISPFFARVFDRLRRVLADAGYPSRLFTGYHLPTASITSRDEDAFRLFHEDVEQGLVVGVATLVTRRSTWSARQGIAWVDYCVDAPYSVTSAEDDLVRQGASYLIEQGCRRLAMLAWQAGCEPGLPSGPVIDIFRETIERAGLEYRPEWVRADLHPNVGSVGWAEFREIWTSHRQIKPDGLFIADDQLLNDAIRAITDLGIRVPQELRIITHANKDLPQAKPPFPIAQVEYDPEAHADAIGEMLLKLLRRAPVIEPHVRVGSRIVLPEVHPFHKQNVSSPSSV